MTTPADAAAPAGTVGAVVRQSESMRRWDEMMSAIILQPRHRWFSASDKDQGDGWDGPYETIGDAIQAALGEGHDPSEPVYVAQGRKRLKWELEELGGDWTWEVATSKALEITLPTITLPNAGGERRPAKETT